MLSDRSQVLARLAVTGSLVRGGAPLRTLDGVNRLPKAAPKPEAVVVLDDRHALIALDTPRAQDNGLVVSLDAGRD